MKTVQVWQNIIIQGRRVKCEDVNIYYILHDVEEKKVLRIEHYRMH